MNKHADDGSRYDLNTLNTKGKEIKEKITEVLNLIENGELNKINVQVKHLREKCEHSSFPTSSELAELYAFERITKVKVDQRRENRKNKLEGERKTLLQKLLPSYYRQQRITHPDYSYGSYPEEPRKETPKEIVNDKDLTVFVPSMFPAGEIEFEQVESQSSKFAYTKWSFKSKKSGNENEQNELKRKEWRALFACIMHPLAWGVPSSNPSDVQKYRFSALIIYAFFETALNLQGLKKEEIRMSISMRLYNAIEKATHNLKHNVVIEDIYTRFPHFMNFMETTNKNHIVDGFNKKIVTFDEIRFLFILFPWLQICFVQNGKKEEKNVLVLGYHGVPWYRDFIIDNIIKFYYNIKEFNFEGYVNLFVEAHDNGNNEPSYDWALLGPNGNAFIDGQSADQR